MSTSTITRRSEEERIAELEQKIAAIKARAARAKAKKDPALRHMHAAVRAIDQALAASSDHATREALGEARSTLAACLALTGAAPRGTLVPQPRRAAAAISEEALLSHVRQHPGQRGEEIARVFGTDTASVRPVMKGLIQKGLVRAEGQARATSYAAN